MPPIPFMGISVILHVLVIASYVFINRVNPKRSSRANKQMCPKISLYMGALIIGLVFGGMSTGAYFLIAASVTNEHSSIRMATEYINSLIVRSNDDSEELFSTNPEEIAKYEPAPFQ